MNKNVFYNVLCVAEYVGFISATILVLIFQFTASQAVMVLSLALYVVAFALLTFSEAVGINELTFSLKQSLKTDDVVAENKQAKAELVLVEAEPLNKGETEQLTTAEIKSKIRWAYAKTIMCGLISLFALLVLILF